MNTIQVYECLVEQHSRLLGRVLGGRGDLKTIEGLPEYVNMSVFCCTPIKLCLFTTMINVHHKYLI